MKLTAIATILAGAVVALPAAAQDRADWPSSLSISTGSQGGAYFVWGSGLASLIGETLNVGASVEVTGGPVQNVVLVETGETLLGFTTMGPAQEAMAGESELMPGMEAANLRALFPMYQTPLQAVVLANSGITAIEDLEGKRVNMGPASGTSATYWQRYFESAGMNVNASFAGASDGAGQLGDGLIDAFVYAAGLPTGAFSPDEADAADAALRAAGILVRKVAGYKLPDCLRITVGDEQACRRILDVIARHKGVR